VGSPSLGRRESRPASAWGLSATVRCRAEPTARWCGERPPSTTDNGERCRRSCECRPRRRTVVLWGTPPGWLLGRRWPSASDETRSCRVGSRPRISVRGRSWPPAGTLDREPSGCRAAATGRRALGSPSGELGPGGRCLHGGPRTARRSSDRPHSPPLLPGSDHRPRRLHDWLGPAPTPPTGRQTCRCGHKGRGSADPGTGWPQPIAGSGVVALWRGEDVSPRGRWTGRSRSWPHAYLHCRCDRSRGPSLLPRCSRLSAVLRPRRTPACLRSISPFAYTSGLC